MFEFILLFIFFWWLFSRNEKRKERKRKLFKPSLDQELKELIQSEEIVSQGKLLAEAGLKYLDEKRLANVDILSIIAGAKWIWTILYSISDFP